MLTNNELHRYKVGIEDGRLFLPREGVKNWHWSREKFWLPQIENTNIGTLVQESLIATRKGKTGIGVGRCVACHK